MGGKFVSKVGKDVAKDVDQDAAAVGHVKEADKDPVLMEASLVLNFQGTVPFTGSHHSVGLGDDGLELVTEAVHGECLKWATKAVLEVKRRPSEEVAVQSMLAAMAATDDRCRPKDEDTSAQVTANDVAVVQPCEFAT